MKDFKILDVQWLTSVFGNQIGIVTIDNGYEIKTYIKQVAGLDEDFDVKNITSPPRAKTILKNPIDKLRHVPRIFPILASCGLRADAA